MRLLLDTHILIDVLDRRDEVSPTLLSLISDPAHVAAVSVASLWEIAIKTRLGKLPLSSGLDELPALLENLNFRTLPVRVSHVLHEVRPWPKTNDPFDRLLLAQCSFEDMLLVTLDGALIDHPLAWQPGSA